MRVEYTSFTEVYRQRVEVRDPGLPNVFDRHCDPIEQTTDEKKALLKGKEVVEPNHAECGNFFSIFCRAPAAHYLKDEVKNFCLYSTTSRRVMFQSFECTVELFSAAQHMEPNQENYQPAQMTPPPPDIPHISTPYQVFLTAGAHWSLYAAPSRMASVLFMPPIRSTARDATMVWTVIPARESRQLENALLGMCSCLIQ